MQLLKAIGCATSCVTTHVVLPCQLVLFTILQPLHAPHPAAAPHPQACVQLGQSVLPTNDVIPPDEGELLEGVAAAPPPPPPAPPPHGALGSN